jgi:integrase
MDLSRVAIREKLAPQREPYWHRLAVGQFIGYRPSKIGKSGTWIARFYDAENVRNLHQSLGDFGRLPANERFAAAKKQAAEWMEHVGSGGSSETITVREACERYAADKPDAAQRFARYVYNDPIAKIALPKLTKRHVKDWRSRLEALPARITRGKSGPQETKARSAATLNRDMVCLRAALNAAKANDYILTDLAWTEALKPAEAVGGRRNLYLDRTQRRALLDHLPADVASFAHALCLLPMRPGAIATLRVGDFDARRGELSIDRDKAGAGRKLLLPKATAELFAEQCRNKLPGAWLFTRADGAPWIKDKWKHPIKDAALAAGLPSDATIYTLRHSGITDLVTDGLDLLTVARLAGTSVKMIEDHYGHLRQKHASEALARLSL